MNRRLIGWIVAAVAAVGLGGLAYLYFAGGSGVPSTDLTTPTIAAPSSSSSTSESPGGTDGGSTTSTSSGGSVVFVIDSAQSSAVFEIDEVLRGADNHVVGSTSEVVGQIAVDLTDLSSTQFSPIVVNARTFSTESSFRDRAIRGPIILDSASDEFEFITFDVTSVGGLSGSAAVGQEITFTISGDLTIKGTTQPATFEVIATLVDETTISGFAETTVVRDDFGIDIPNAPGLAGVSQEVLIRLEFMAVTG